MKPLTLYEVVKIFEAEPLNTLEDTAESYKFRIEILTRYRGDGQYYPRVYRRETYRLQPTFPLLQGEPENECWDHEMLVLDEAVDWENCTGQSVEEVLDKVTQKIHETFHLIL